MKEQSKCVMVIDENLPLGLISNTAAVLGVAIGRNLPEVVGSDVVDQTGNRHLGITEIPIPILRSSKEQIKELRSRLYEDNYRDLIVVDFSDAAQSCNNYEEYTGKMANAPESSLSYLGLALCGDKKKVNKLTGSMPLMR